jgi:predicted TIM-barrel fold metal-dependent hydrolase
MTIRFIDIHPHIISDNAGTYARVPLFGVQSDWSRDRPVTIDGLVAAMDEAGVDKAAIVQSSTCYGYDNSYLVDSVAKHPKRFTAVGSVDVAQADAPKRISEWVKKGVSGLRLFTGGSTQDRPVRTCAGGGVGEAISEGSHCARSSRKARRDRRCSVQACVEPVRSRPLREYFPEIDAAYFCGR